MHHAYIYIYMYVCVHMYIYIYMYTHTYTYIHMRIHVFCRERECVCARVNRVNIIRTRILSRLLHVIPKPECLDKWFKFALRNRSI